MGWSYLSIVQRTNNAIRRINYYPADRSYQNVQRYPPDTPFEQPGQELHELPDSE